MPEPPIIFDFTKGQVYRTTEHKGLMRDLMRALKQALAIQRRVAMTAAGTPPPQTTQK